MTHYLIEQILFGNLKTNEVLELKYNFIKTSDEETKDLLLKEGFEMISKDGNVYTFINDCSQSFDNQKRKVQYTNKIYI